MTRKLNPKWITSYFKGYEGEEKLSGDQCEVMPYWMGYREVEEKDSISVAEMQGLEDADQLQVDGMHFGYEEPAPWGVL